MASEAVAAAVYLRPGTDCLTKSHSIQAQNPRFGSKPGP